MVWIVDLFPLKGIDLALFLCQIPIFFGNDSFVTEFGKFGGLLEKVQKNLQNAGDQLEEVMGKRTRAIERKLRQVEALPAEDSQRMLSLPELTDDEDDE